MSATPVVESRHDLRGRIYSLDGLRGVAAFSVVFHHAIIVAYQPLKAIYTGNQPIEPAGSLLWWFTHTPLHVPWLGAEAVYTFFILSGLVLTLPVLNSTSYKWLSYYPKRLVRLYLPVWGSLVVVVALTLLVGAANIQASQGWADAHAAKFTLSNLLRDAFVLRGLTPINGVLWSLRWEILFSLLLPLYVMFAISKRVAWYIKLAAIFIAALLGRTVLVEHELFGELFFYMPMFGLGAIMAAEFGRMESMAARISSSVHSATLWAAIVGATALLLSTYWIALAFAPPVGALEVSRILSFLGAGLLVFIAAFNPRARRLLEMHSAQRLAIISFSLYLIHGVLLEAIDAVLPGGLEWLVLVAGIPLSLLLATVFYRYVEFPSSNLAKRVQLGGSAPTRGPKPDLVK